MAELSAQDRTELGKTGISIPVMGTGAWSWGDRMMWGFGQEYGVEDVRQAFDASLEGGINFFDTAEVYGLGMSERLLGRFARQTAKPLVVATKFMPFPWRLSEASMLRALRHSLQRLQMDQVDLYQIHFPLPPVSLKARAHALGRTAKDGLTRSVGVSNYNVEQMRRTYLALQEEGIPLASNQVEYSLLNRQVEKAGLLALCQELGITLIAYSPLAKGLLTGKYTPENPPPGVRGLRARGGDLRKIQPLIGLIQEIGQSQGGKTPAQVALNWCICKGSVPIPGAKNARQARDNAQSMEWRLTQEQVAALDEASDRL